MGDPDEPYELPEVTVTGRAPQIGDISYTSDGYQVVYIGEKNHYVNASIAHLPLPGGSWKNMIQSLKNLKSIPSAIKNIFSVKSAGGW